MSPTETNTTNPSSSQEKLSLFKKYAPTLFGVGLVAIGATKLAAHFKAFDNITHPIANAISQYHGNIMNTGVATAFIILGGSLAYAAYKYRDDQKPAQQKSATPA